MNSSNPIVPGHSGVPAFVLPASRQMSSDEDSSATVSPYPTIPALDAAKRKQLPAWIREGLEKMEREKQKKEERERFLSNRELQRKKEMVGKLTEEQLLTRSRFDDDDDSDDDENGPEINRVESPPRRVGVSLEDMVQLFSLNLVQLIVSV